MGLKQCSNNKWYATSAYESKGGKYLENYMYVKSWIHQENLPMSQSYLMHLLYNQILSDILMLSVRSS